MADEFEKFTTSLIAPAEDLVPVTPNDGEDIPVARALYVSGAGTLRITTRRGHVRNIPNAVEGYHPVFVRRVHATGTTATGILAAY